MRSGANGGTHGARSDATRRAAQREGQHGAKAARTQGRRGASKGGGGLSHLGGGAFSANSSAPPGSTHTMSVSRQPHSAV
eukprot:scaffold3492_cov55-Phaeocystis_antarctica.AAC.3